MNIYLISEENLFDDNQNKLIQEFGKIIYCSNDNENTYKILKNDYDEKIIIYDPDYAGWNIPEKIVRDISNIKAIFLGTTDISYVDVNICEEKGIEIYNIPKYATRSVAEYLVMYMFSCAKKISMQFRNNNSQEFSEKFLQMQLKGKKVGIIGLGNIGSEIASICYGIGMEVCYWSREKNKQILSIIL